MRRGSLMEGFRAAEPAALPVPDPDVVATLEANCEKEGTEGYVGIPVPFY